MATFTTSTGLVLDDTDPDDRKILAKQRAAAKQAGRTGGDRAAVTQGRADLATAYDEGVADAAAPSAPAAGGARKGKASAAGAAKSTRAGMGFRQALKAGGSAVTGAVGDTRKGLPAPRLRPPRTASLKDAGGFALGMVLHALVVSYIRYGAAGPKGWMKAKFLNKPIQGRDLERRGPDGEELAETLPVPPADETPII